MAPRNSFVNIGRPLIDAATDPLVRKALLQQQEQLDRIPGGASGTPSTIYPGGSAAGGQGTGGGGSGGAGTPSGRTATKGDAGIEPGHLLSVAFSGAQRVAYRADATNLARPATDVAGAVTGTTVELQAEPNVQLIVSEFVGASITLWLHPTIKGIATNVNPWAADPSPIGVNQQSVGFAQSSRGSSGICDAKFHPGPMNQGRSA